MFSSEFAKTVNVCVFEGGTAISGGSIRESEESVGT